MKNLLPVTRAHALVEQSQQHRWLIEGLWAEQAVGIIGGEPKCCKSFLALTLSVAVASGKSALGRFPVKTRGKVLIYPAEDALHIIRRRLEGICSAHNLSLEKLPIYVITAPGLRLDIESDRARLKETIEKLRPTLLILDPFVRLHAIDENASGEVAKILHHLRLLQRSFKLAVALVHHSRKGGAKHRAGQALRGSSDFHAWGDSNLYLRRNNSDELSLTIEHRAEASPETLPLLLDAEHFAHLRIDQNSKPTSLHAEPLSPEKQIIQALQIADHPIRATKLRETLPIRNVTVSQTLLKLQENGLLKKSKNGYSILTKSK